MISILVPATFAGALVAASIAVAQPAPLAICQPDYASAASVRVYNFRRSPVPDVEPSPLPAGVRVHSVPVPPQRTPVPTPHQPQCPDLPTTTYLVVDPAPLTGPGTANAWAAWAVSSDGIASARSNVLVRAPDPPTAPRLLP